MALIKCPKCSNMVSDKADRCPHCGHPIIENNPDSQEQMAANDDASGYYEKASSRKWLYALIGVLVVAVAGLAFLLFGRNGGGNGEVKELVERLSAAVTKGDSLTVRSLYPNAQQADSLSLVCNIDSLQIEETDNGWKVSAKEGLSLLVERDKSTDSLYVKESYGIFAYPQKRLALAKGTGWYDTSLNDLTNAERMADTLFVNWLKEKAVKWVKDQVKITKSAVRKGKASASSYVPIEEFDTFCTVEVSNQSDNEIAGDAYSVYAREKWNYQENCFSPDMSVQTTMESGTPKTLTGKPIPAKGSVTYSWKGEGGYGSAHQWTTDYRLDSSLTFTSRLAATALDAYTPTGNEYQEYLAEKGK